MSYCLLYILQIVAVKTYVNGNINIIVVSRIHINGVEASARSIDDLQPLAFLHCQVDQDRPVWQI